MTTTASAVAAGPEEKSAKDMITEMEDYTRRFREMRKDNPARMMPVRDLISYNETLTATLNAMMATLFAYMDLGLQSLQDSGIGTEAVRPFITLTEQVLFAQSRLVLMVCQQAGFLNENGVTEKMSQEARAAFQECDSMVRNWTVKRDSFLEHLSKIEAERAAEEDDEDEDEEEDEDGDEGDNGAESPTESADPADGGDAQ